jgi:transcription initiation factor IIE alpha subunit
MKPFNCSYCTFDEDVTSPYVCPNCGNAAHWLDLEERSEHEIAYRKKHSEHQTRKLP